MTIARVCFFGLSPVAWLSFGRLWEDLENSYQLGYHSSYLTTSLQRLFKFQAWGGRGYQ